MFDLLLSTLAMMGLTFVIGFFVAGVIKVIANWADFLDFYQTHREEILGMKKAHKVHPVMEEVYAKGNESFGNKHRKLTHRVHETISSLKPQKSVTA